MVNTHETRILYLALYEYDKHSDLLGESVEMMCFVTRVMRRIFGPKKGEMTERTFSNIVR